MATHKEAAARADDVLGPLQAARAARELEDARASFRRARFALGATVAIAAIYAGFIAVRFAQGRTMDALSIIVVFLVLLAAANAFKRFRLARLALQSLEQSAAT